MLEKKAESMGGSPEKVAVQQEQVEKPVEGGERSSNRIVQAVRDAPPNSIIIVSGFPEAGRYAEPADDRTESAPVKIVNRTESQGLESLLSETKDNASIEREKKLVINVPSILRDTFFADGTTDAETIERLLAPSDDPVGVLSKWLKTENEKTAGDLGTQPGTRALQIFEKIQTLAYHTNRPILLAMPASSPLALAFFAGILSEWHLDEAAVERVREHVGSGADKIAFLKMENGVASVSFGAESVVSRPLY